MDFATGAAEDGRVINTNQNMNKKQLLDIAKTWFAQQDWKAFKFQKDTWQEYLKGKNGLLNAPTGSGKTYALWVPIVLEILQQKSRKRNPLRV